jgi:hypothetical protein
VLDLNVKTRAHVQLKITKSFANAGQVIAASSAVRFGSVINYIIFDFRRRSPYLRHSTLSEWWKL